MLGVMVFIVVSDVEVRGGFVDINHNRKSIIEGI
jgi:hypothetical protein